MVKSGSRMFRDKLKELLPPRSIRIIKHLFAKLPEFFNANDSDRFRDGFPPLIIDSSNVLKFFKWHRTPLFGPFALVRTESIIFGSPEQGKRNKQTAI